MTYLFEPENVRIGPFPSRPNFVFVMVPIGFPLVANVEGMGIVGGGREVTDYTSTELLLLYHLDVRSPCS
jgi:hypothetical protein